MSNTESFEVWRKSFIDIYSAAPYQKTLGENADNLFNYWELTWDYYMSVNLFNPMHLFNLFSSVIYILLSITIHVITLLFILPVSALFLNSDENIQSTLIKWAHASSISIQSFFFALMDLIVQPLIFALSILLSPAKFFKSSSTEHIHEPVLSR
jgi:hypothetical protein